jgi:hypothetical protein
MPDKRSHAYLHRFHLFLFLFRLGFGLARLRLVILVIVFLSVRQTPRALLFRSILCFDGIKITQGGTKLL